MAGIDREKVTNAIYALGSGRLDGVSRIGDAFDRLASFSDEELAFALVCVRTSAGTRQAESQLESIRLAIRTLVDLRSSQRQKEQAEALIAAVEQLKKTESMLERGVGLLAKAIPIAEKAYEAGGGGG